METFVFAVDDSDRPLAPVPRSQAIRERLWRRTGGILLANPTYDHILCHKRSETKDERPGVWVVMFGGKCDPGETPSETCIRELREEAAINITDQQLHYFGKVKSEKHRQFEYLHWANWSGDAEKLAHNPKEVAEIKWVNTDEAYAKLSQNAKDWYCYSPKELSLIRLMQTLVNSSAAAAK